MGQPKPFSIIEVPSPTRNKAKRQWTEAQVDASAGCAGADAPQQRLDEATALKVLDEHRQKNESIKKHLSARAQRQADEDAAFERQKEFTRLHNMKAKAG